MLAAGVGLWALWQFVRGGRAGDVISRDGAKSHHLGAAGRWQPWPLLVLIGALYGFSFFLPMCTTVKIDHTTQRGIWRPATGYEIFIKAGMPVWLAHPLLWLGCLALMARKWRSAAFAGLIAVLLPGLSDFTGLLAGYWMWKTSMVLLAGGGFYGWWRSRRQGQAGNIKDDPARNRSAAVRPSPGLRRLLTERCFVNGHPGSCGRNNSRRRVGQRFTAPDSRSRARRHNAPNHAASSR